MNQPPLVPQLPENAPFSAEQRAYLNGFLAGMFSRVAVAASAGGSAPPSAQPLTPLTIAFGSQTGTAEKLAKRIAKEAGKRGFAPITHDLANITSADLASARSLLIIASTYGDGDPPDTAKAFWTSLSEENAPRLTATRFSVCALGDTNYAKFCAFGKGLDARLEALGGARVHARTDCDLDYEAPFTIWLEGALRSLLGSQENNQTATPSGATGTESAQDTDSPRYSKTQPYAAPLIHIHLLSGAGSEKETRHFAFQLSDPDMRYETGDALDVIPTNCPKLVEDLIRALGASPETPVPSANGAPIALMDALLTTYEITRIPKALMQWMAERTGDESLLRLVDPNVNGELTQFLKGREVIDLLLSHSAHRPSAVEFVGLLKKLQPRLYSISSSPRAHLGEVHLTVGIVRYSSLGRDRKGVCSSFLADRAGAGPVPVFVHENRNFRPPELGETPMIMVGPGTGVAPFRGFLHDRSARGSQGKNWLFFGDQRASTDFLYRDELETLKAKGILNRLDVAFSRDQKEKVYVQQRMLENASELYAWLEQGAHFYVCGDASRMAKDVDSALHRVVEEAGGKTVEQAQAYIADLKKSKRYQRDVY